MKLFPRVKDEFFEQKFMELKGTHLVLIAMIGMCLPQMIVLFTLGEDSPYLKMVSFWALWGLISLFSTKKHITKWDIKYLLIGFPSRIFIYLGYRFMIRKYTYLTKSEFREKRLKKVLRKRIKN